MKKFSDIDVRMDVERKLEAYTPEVYVDIDFASTGSVYLTFTCDEVVDDEGDPIEFVIRVSDHDPSWWRPSGHDAEVYVTDHAGRLREHREVVNEIVDLVIKRFNLERDYSMWQVRLPDGRIVRRRFYDDLKRVAALSYRWGTAINPFEYVRENAVKIGNRQRV